MMSCGRRSPQVGLNVMHRQMHDVAPRIAQRLIMRGVPQNVMHRQMHDVAPRIAQRLIMRGVPKNVMHRQMHDKYEMEEKRC